ncbi:uncharacterized protein IWZ02DRAFT_522682 [Phyllosticta citriasiana]|uniref:uncharacterized protein n=1 Tax=Phyllosticta citriasiana TaxID=595635 RepID=UPI0030FD5E80
MSRNKVAVGSAPWILSERQQVDQFVEQEAEEFSYSVRNELEWLNEHMADIFSQNQVNVADVFKTPGKLRGKTPRTVRKKNPMEIRAFYKQVEEIQIAEDPEPSTMPPPSQSASEVNNTTYPMRPGDSGYHGMTEDEMEVEHEDVAVASPRKESPAKPPRSSPLKQPEMNMNTKSPSASFVSAAENVQDQEENANATPSKEESDEENMSAQEEEMIWSRHNRTNLHFLKKSRRRNRRNSEEPVEPEEQSIGDMLPEEMEVDGARTPSEQSSPEKTAGVRNSYIGRLTGGKSLGGSHAIPQGAAEDEAEQSVVEPEELEASKLHSKTSTQQTQEEDDDDWIAPVSKPLPPQRPVLARANLWMLWKMSVTSRVSVRLNEDLPEETDRPLSSAGSPAEAELGLSRAKTVPDYQSPAKYTLWSPQRATEGTQSAKSKFYSVLKSAKSIFASSAGVSAQAKMEALSPATMRLKQNAPPMEEVSSPRRPLSSVFDKPVNTAPPAHRQAPTETPEKKRAEEELEKLREQERKRAAETAHKEKQAAKSGKEMAANSRIGATGRVEPAADNEEEPMSEDEAPAPQATKSQSTTGTQKPKEPRSRLVKPSKESIPKPRTHIKVGLGSHRGQPTNADLSKSLHGTLAPTSKPAAESTTNSFSRSIGPSSAPVAKPNSLALAAKNKEKEEREAQRKAEKKRQIEQQTRG